MDINIKNKIEKNPDYDLFIDFKLIYLSLQKILLNNLKQAKENNDILEQKEIVNNIKKIGESYNKVKEKFTKGLTS